MRSPPALDGESLRAFTVFAELLNFTRAAERLHISQPALHARIKRLALELDTELYRREGRRLQLTHAGEQLLSFAREIDGRTREFYEELHGCSTQAPVVLAAGEGSFLYLLGDPIRRFVRRGQAPLRLLMRDREGLLLALRSGQAQLGVTTLELLPEGLEYEALRETPQVLVMPSRHPLAKRRKLDLSALAGERMIVAPAGRPHRLRFAAAMLERQIAWEPAVEVHGWPAMLHCVRLGLGLAVVNGSVKIPRGLVARPLHELERTRYFLVRARYLSDAARELAELILEELRED